MSREFKMDKMYCDDIIHIGAECGCFARYGVHGKNQHGGDLMTGGWSACKDHEFCDFGGFMGGVKAGIIKVNDIHIINGLPPLSATLPQGDSTK